MPKNIPPSSKGKKSRPGILYQPVLGQNCGRCQVLQVANLHHHILGCQVGCEDLQADGQDYCQGPVTVPCFDEAGAEMQVAIQDHEQQGGR